MTGNEDGTSAVEGGQKPAGLTEEMIEKVHASPPTTPSEGDGVAEATQIIIGEAVAADKRRDAQDATGKEVEAKVVPEKKDAGKEGDEDFTLPWDKPKQQRDQADANLRKMVKRQGEQIEALTQRLSDGPPPEDRLDAVLAELAELDDPDPLDEESAAKFKVKRTKLLAEARSLRETMTDRGKAKAKAKDEASRKQGVEQQEEEESKPKVPTKAEFIVMCEEAEAEFGSHLRQKARIVVRSEWKAQGYGPNKAPTHGALQKLVTRVYRTLSEVKAPVKEPEQHGQQPPGGQQSPHAPPGMRMTTVRDAAAKLRRALRSR